MRSQQGEGMPGQIAQYAKGDKDADQDNASLGANAVTPDQWPTDHPAQAPERGKGSCQRKHYERDHIFLSSLRKLPLYESVETSGAATAGTIQPSELIQLALGVKGGWAGGML